MITVFLFWLCIIYAFYQKMYIYSLLWFMLFITSYLVHYVFTDSKVFSLIDKLIIYTTIVLGGYYYYCYSYSKNGVSKYLAPICFILVTVVYYTKVARHEFVHIFSVIGHLLIMASYRSPIRSMSHIMSLIEFQQILRQVVAIYEPLLSFLAGRGHLGSLLEFLLVH